MQDDRTGVPDVVLTLKVDAHVNGMVVFSGISPLKYVLGVEENRV
jgi:hypothetical protein